MASLLLAALRLFLAALGVARCVAQDAGEAREESAAPAYEPTYQFKYHVSDLATMDYKTHEEIGENGFVRGTYTVREPNGDLRVVSYTAGDSRGFQAMVRVRPTHTSARETETEPREEQHSTEKSASKNESSSVADAPLKIQLDTGRRVYRTRQREQRHRKPEQQSTQRNSGSQAAASDPKYNENCKMLCSTEHQ